MKRFWPIVALGLLASQSSANADTTMATVLKRSPISAYNRLVVWSTYDPASRTYSLTQYLNGTISTVPVPPRRFPFDVDLGPGPGGATLATYSRCQRERFRRDGTGIDYPSGRCDVYTFNFTTGLESKIREVSTSRGSEYSPTVWAGVKGSFIAFVRSYPDRDGRRGGLPHIYVRNLGRASSSRPLPGGPRGRAPGPFIHNLDLRGRRLAFLWSYFPRPVPGRHTDQEVSQVRLSNINGRIHKPLYEDRVTGEEGLTVRFLLSPAWGTAHVYFLSVVTGDYELSSCLRYSPSTGRIGRALIPGPLAATSLAVDGDVVYYGQGIPYTDSSQARFNIIRAERLIFRTH